MLLIGSEVAERFGLLTSEIEMCGKEVGYLKRSVSFRSMIEGSSLPY